MQRLAVVAMRVVRLPLDAPPEVEEVVDGARQLQRPRGVETVHLLCRLEEPLEEGMVEVGDGDNELPEAAFFAFEADSHGDRSLLHLHPLVLLHHLFLLSPFVQCGRWKEG